MAVSVFRQIRLDSIKGKIVVFAVLAALVPTLVTATIAYTNSRRALTEQVGETLQSSSAQAAREIGLWLDDRVRDLRVFAGSYEVTDNLEALRDDHADASSAITARTRLTSYLSVLEEQFPDYQELLVTDLDGHPLADTGDHRELPSSWLSQLETEPVILGNASSDPALETATIDLGVPVRGTDRRLLAAMAARLDLRPAGEILSAFAPDGSARLHLATRAGVPVLAGDADGLQFTGLGLADGSVRAIWEGRTRPARYIDGRGVEVLGAFAELSRLDLVVVAEVTEAHAYAQMAGFRNVTILVVVILLVAVGFIAYRLGLIIVRPLDHLTRAAAEVARGDLAVDLPVMGGGEVGYLTAVFNNMVGRLQEGRQKLDAIHEKLRLKNEQLERLSITDGLTGLYNRRHLMDSLNREARRTRRSKHSFSILLLDVDHFKQLNDTHGHQIGDDVLARMASILEASIREVDIAARYGGEEFVLLLPETDVDGAVIVAQRIRARVAAEAFVFRDKSISVTVSIGVAGFPEDARGPESLLAAADAALYQAKRHGRDRVNRADSTGARIAEPSG